MSNDEAITAAPQHMGEVLPGIWIGGLSALSQLDVRKKWTVISVLSSEALIQLAHRIISQSSVIQRHYLWRLQDSPTADLLDEHHWTHVSRILKTTREDQPCLIHCAKGMSRSVAVCTTWLLISNQCSTLEQALQCIRQVRPQAQPNLGFVASLRAIEQCDGDLSKARKRMSRLSKGE